MRVDAVGGTPHDPCREAGPHDRREGVMTPLLRARQQLWERPAATSSWSLALPPGSPWPRPPAVLRSCSRDAVAGALLACCHCGHHCGSAPVAAPAAVVPRAWWQPVDNCAPSQGSTGLPDVADGCCRWLLRAPAAVLVLSRPGTGRAAAGNQPVPPFRVAKAGRSPSAFLVSSCRTFFGHRPFAGPTRLCVRGLGRGRVARSVASAPATHTARCRRRPV